MATKKIELPGEGTQPNVLARSFREQGLLMDTLQAKPHTEIGKRFRGELRSAFADSHTLHSQWPLTRAQMLHLLTKYGNERGRKYAAAATAASKRTKRTKVIAKPETAE
jgi:hypothetical protein